jgi:hypothetical protein
MTSLRSALWLPIFDELADPWLTEFPPDAVSLDVVRGVPKDGPA